MMAKALLANAPMRDMKRSSLGMAIAKIPIMKQEQYITHGKRYTRQCYISLTISRSKPFGKD